MFGRLVIKYNNEIEDLGLFCEGLIFYEHVVLIVNYASLASLLSLCTYRSLAILLRKKRVTIYYNNHALGAGVSEADDLYIADSFTNDVYGKQAGIAKAVDDLYERGVNNANIQRHLNTVILNHRYSEGFLDILRKQLQNGDDLKKAIKILELEPEIEAEVSVEKEQGWLYRIESEYQKDTIWKAAQFIVVASGFLHDASLYACAMATNRETSQFIEYRYNNSLKRREIDIDNLKNFHHHVLPDFIDIRGSMNQKNKSFHDFLMLLWEAEQFEEWLSSESPTSELLTAYLAKLREKTWLEAGGVKTLRWGLFNLIGLGLGTIVGDVVEGTTGTVLGNAAAVATDGFDDLLLDKIIRSDMPDLFVQGQYKGFLEPHYIQTEQNI